MRRINSTLFAALILITFGCQNTDEEQSVEKVHGATAQPGKVVAEATPGEPAPMDSGCPYAKKRRAAGSECPYMKEMQAAHGGCPCAKMEVEGQECPCPYAKQMKADGKEWTCPKMKAEGGEGSCPYAKKMRAARGGCPYAKMKEGDKAGAVSE